MRVFTRAHYGLPKLGYQTRLGTKHPVAPLGKLAFAPLKNGNSPIDVGDPALNLIRASC